jgi:hypothetical protein
MTTAAIALQRPPRREWPIKVRAAGLLLFGAIATAGATVFGNGNPVLAIAPVLLVVVAYALFVSPIRYGLFALTFLCLTLDAVGEGAWNSPFAKIGNLFLFNLNKVVPISALTFPGMAVLMVTFLALLVHRRAVGVTTDSRNQAPAALALYGAILVSVATIVLWCALGLVRGGNLQMAKIQVQSYLLLLLLAYLWSMSLRGLPDYRILGRIIIAAAVYRCLYIGWVYHVIAPRLGGGILGVAATHGDSLLLATAAVLLIGRFFEKPSLRMGAWLIALMPILVLGMQWNNRRIVWVELAAGTMVFILLSRPSRIKRLLTYCVMLALPLLVGYVAIGWNSQSRIFAPIKMYRSVTDGQVDSSTLYRDLENFNLLMTMRLRPLDGTGFGQMFLEDVKLPDISLNFKEYRYMPHNSILGLWAFIGPIGFSGLFMAVAMGVYLAARSYRMARSPDERITAMMVLSTIIIYLSHCWGDIGFSEFRTIYLVGPALAIAAQLAVMTGAVRGSGHSTRVSTQ